jgi:amino acid adenylation domain-containing protein
VAEAWNGDIPLGRPIANTRVYVVGLHGDPKPVGVIGEICAAGDGLARGYLGSPELTEARFVPNLFEPGERMYRTGDLGYLRADGALAYAGRRDAQVKVRGFRVELGEIEAALARHPDARQAVVLARPGAGGTNELAAYVAGVAAEDPSALRRFLADILPDYMVPAEIIALDGLPLTPNGKVDRAALGALRASAAPREEVADAAGPRSAIEEKLCEIWRDVLQVPSLGITDDFFELGGHSLVATRIVSRVYRDLSAEINISDIFLNPTIEQLAAVIEGAARAADAGELRPVEPQPFYPLSRAQQRMWVLHQLDPRGVIYNIARAYLLDGPLDLDAFRRAIRALVARHEALRTTFAVVDGAPAQRVHEELPFEIREIDLRGEPHAEERVRAVFFADAQTPFDLERGPLFRVHLLRLEERRHVQCFNIHHVLIDVWSTNILFDDLIALYNAFARGDPDPLAPLPLQYKDFAAWQRRFERTEAFRQQRRYWHAELAGELPTLELPTDRPRPRVKTWHGALQRFELSPEQSEAVRALSHEESSSVFITMLAVFKVLLYRLSGQDDILVGTPVVDRPDEVLERQVGLYLNTIVLRSRLSGEEPFRAFLARLTRAVLETYDNKSYPFDLLADELVPERDASRNPLFDVLVIGYNLPETKGGLRGVEMRPLHYDRELDRSQFDLTIDFEDRDVIFGELEYNTDLFDAATIERMLGHFQVLLAGALASPDRCIAELSLLTGIERQLLVEGYNATAAVLDGAPVHQRIAAQADRTPQATAVVFEGARLTYRELDRRANQLAHHLRRFGVGPDVPVAVCLDRSIEMVIALLGILKAGGAYLPLDPSYPKGRLQFMVADAGAAVLITEERLADRLYLSTRHVVRIDRAWAAIGRESESPPHVPLSEQNLVHVIYTSGSTGKPKGVMSTHGGLRNRLLWGQATYPLSLEDRVLQKTPFGFDVSVWELFWPLLTGAILVMARPGGHQDPSYLVRTLVEERITTVHFVPSMLRAFLDDPDVERCRSVRQVFCSGEALPYELQERYFARLEAPLYNLYGPTEASIEVSHWTCQRRGERQIVPIGRPIANAQLHVLDALMQPAPIGVAGELYLGGAGLARGYIGRPDLTAERFVPDPFGPPGARLYRSGDRARRLPDGAIEYLGRLDDQIKIRGLRIELGEIASALMDQAGVRDAVVVARGERLVAYVVLDEAAAPVEELKRALKERLPGYMVPPSFVVMRELPRTPSGKIDRKALPEPDGESDGAAAYVAPRTPPEQMLTGMIADALGRERIGIDDDFFERGGHSLKAMSLLLRLRERLDCPISLVDLYDHPTARTLAAWVEERRAATG